MSKVSFIFLMIASFALVPYVFAFTPVSDSDDKHIHDRTSTENTGFFPPAYVGNFTFDYRTLHGTWHEVWTSKSIVQQYESDCTGQTTEFTPVDAELMDVKTTCTKSNGELQITNGQVRPWSDQPGSGRLQLTMYPYEPEWTPYSNYIVIKTFSHCARDRSIDTLLVGSDEDDMFWLYSRRRHVSKRIKQDALLALRKAQYKAELVFELNSTSCV